MTSNQLLLYRIAELMLEHEQHILPVDLLFDDEQIGDFVKSIQIDSPYQQILIEGVLTESVRDEKLYVSFTIEGYFHYVLGEVIYHRTEGLGTEALMQIVEENKLNGAKEGVEQSLNKEISKASYSRLIKLIDFGGEMIPITIKPLTNLFLTYTIKRGTKTKQREIFEHASNVITKLFMNPTENDIKAISETVQYLDKNEKNELFELANFLLNRAH